MAKGANEYILEVERKLIDPKHLNPGTATDFCLSALVKAEPTDADADYGKKLIMNRLLREPGNFLTCNVKECNVAIPKSELNIHNGTCALASYCLKSAWDVRNNEDEDSEKLYTDTTAMCEKLPGAFRCPNPLCELSAGWSEDGVPGTDGECSVEIESASRKPLFSPVFETPGEAYGTYPTRHFYLEEMGFGTVYTTTGSTISENMIDIGVEFESEGGHVVWRMSDITAELPEQRARQAIDDEEMLATSILNAVDITHQRRTFLESEK